MSSLPDRLKRLVEFDVNKAHRIICDLAAGKHRWQMCVPPQADDSDMVLQDSLDHIERLSPLIHQLIQCVEALQDIETNRASLGYAKHARKALTALEDACVKMEEKWLL